MVLQRQPWRQNLDKHQVKSPKIDPRVSGLEHQHLGLVDVQALLPA